MKKFNKSIGFTLIELIVVIVILGILAVSAAPKFVDLKSDAVSAQLKSMAGSINSAIKLSRAKTIIAGKENIKYTFICLSLSNCTSSSSDAVSVRFGIPYGTEIKKMLDYDENDWNIFAHGPGGNVCVIPKFANAKDQTSCPIVTSPSNYESTKQSNKDFCGISIWLQIDDSNLEKYRPYIFDDGC